MKKAVFETKEMNRLVDTILKQPTCPKLEAALYADEKQFFWRKAVPAAAVFEILVLAICWSIGSPAWVMLTVTGTVLVGAAMHYPRK